MTDLTHLQDVEQIAAKLSGAWTFLSGEHREFKLLLLTPGPLRFAEFSFFMSLTVYAEGRTGGVGVLVQRADALSVAAHMFGVQEADVQEDDLRDACSEVCNVFSGCIASHVSGNAEVSIGLPAMANPQEYNKIATDSVVTAVYQSSLGTTNLFVIVYEILRQPT
jgi:hypothetical protein